MLYGYLLGYVICMDMSNWWGKRWPLVACPFHALVVLWRMLVISSLYYIFNEWVIIFVFIRIPKLFLYTNCHFEKRMYNLPRSSFISKLHTKQRIIRRNIPGLATDSPSGVWGNGWTTFLLYDGPLLGLWFQMISGVWVWYIDIQVPCIWLHFV